MHNSDPTEKIYTIVNVYAASKKAGKRWRQAKRLLEDRGVDCQYVLTGNLGTAASLALEACALGYRKFLAVGGDGTAHDVQNGLVSYSQKHGQEAPLSDFTLGVIPMGSGNDWIKSLGIRQSVRDAVNVIASGRTVGQDVVRLSCRSLDSEGESVTYMANVGGVGIDANVCEIVNNRKKHGEGGKILYVKALVKSIRDRKPSPLKVFSDGTEVYCGDYLSIAFGVGKYSGGGMRQTPEAVINDGLLDMTVIPDIPIMRIAREVYKLFTGSFLTIPEVIATKSRSVRITHEEGYSSLIEVDGEIVGRTPMRAEVLEGSINVYAGSTLMVK